MTPRPARMIPHPLPYPGPPTRSLWARESFEACFACGGRRVVVGPVVYTWGEQVLPGWEPCPVCSAVDEEAA